jgi:hypothetical protein
VDDVLIRWLDLPTHHGGMHDIVMWYYVVNAWMHSVDVARGIGTLIVIIWQPHTILLFEQEITFSVAAFTSIL